MGVCLNSIHEGKQIHVFTLGFTAEFVIKPLLEVGAGESTYIAVLYTVTRDEYSRKRVDDAINYIERLSREAGFVSRVFFLQVPLPNSLYDLVYEVANALVRMLKSAEVRASDIEGVDVWLTGGMRVLVISTLIATKMLFEHMKVPVTYHAWSEDGVYKYAFNPQLLNLSLEDVSRTRMEVLKRVVSLGECSYEELADAERRESTIRKLVELLRKDNLVDCRRAGRHTICRATELGTLVVKMMELVEVVL